ncbi:MAG TPA: biopolymer transporter ExbD [Anaeromyxobacteraceae bacterium]|nr:biopolymer transporter ExbD [Anaeromyxobacteraceae bacterium]
MPIVQPGKRPAKRLQGSRVFGAKLTRSARPTNTELNVVPFVDIMTILVLFLLQQFSATGEVLYMQKDIRLPEARHGQPIEPAPVIAISGAQLSMDGRRVTDTLSIEKDPFLTIPALEEQLRDARKRWEFVHQNDPERDRAWRGEVNLQADERVPFKLVKRVMYSAAQAGYPNVNFATLERTELTEAGASASR